MTERNDPRPPTPTGPTEPVPPAASAAPATPAGPPAGETATGPRRPWYRHVWVPVAGALVLVLLAFGSGFVAGQGAAVFGALTASADDGPGSGEGHVRGHSDGGPGSRDGGPGSHERGPGSRDGGIPGQREGAGTETETE